MLPFFPVVLTVIPAAVEGVLRFSSPIFGVAAGITLLVTHYVTLSSFRDAQLADAADRGLAASHAGVLGLTIIAGACVVRVCSVYAVHTVNDSPSPGGSPLHCRHGRPGARGGDSRAFSCVTPGMLRCAACAEQDLRRPH